MYKRLGVAILLMTLVVTSVMPKVSADTGLNNENYLPQCADASLLEWDWGGAAAHVTNGPSDFNYDTSSYVVLHHPNSKGTSEQVNDLDGHPENTNRYDLFTAPLGYKLSFYTDANGVVKLASSYSGGFMTIANIINESNQNPDYSRNWGNGFGTGYGTAGFGRFSPSAGTFVNAGAPVTNGRAIPIYSGVTGSVGTTYDCEYGAKNTTYAASFTYNQFNSNVLHGQPQGTGCSVTDLPCIIGKAFQGVQNTLIGIVTATLGFLQNLFVPDATQMKASFDDFNSFMAAKLGFLVYPFTFIYSFFNSFSSTGGFCNSTSCVLDAGNFMGGNFSINLLQMRDTFPTYWALITNVVRGTTVMALLFAIREAYRRTTDR